MKRIPRSVNKLTLEQYSKLRAIESEKINTEDDSEVEVTRATKILSMLTGIEVDFIERKMPTGEVEHYFKQIADLRATVPTTKVKKILWIGGKRYKICKSEKQMNANQFTAADTYRVNHVSNYHLLAAIVYMDCPIFGKHQFNENGFDDLAEKMKQQKVGDVFGAVFFYSNVLTNLRRTTLNFIKSQKEILQERLAEVEQGLKDIGINTDGTISQMLSQMETHLAKMN